MGLIGTVVRGRMMTDELWRRARAAFRESRRLVREAEHLRRSGEGLRHDLAGTLEDMRDFNVRASAWLRVGAVRPDAPRPTRRL